MLKEDQNVKIDELKIEIVRLQENEYKSRQMRSAFKSSSSGSSPQPRDSEGQSDTPNMQPVEPEDEEPVKTQDCSLM